MFCSDGNWNYIDNYPGNLTTDKFGREGEEENKRIENIKKQGNSKILKILA